VTTKPDVLNETLFLLGQPQMNGPADTSSWVRRITARYAPTVKLLLECHPWNFPAQRVALELAEVAGTSVGREYKYNKPADCLRINMINDTGSTNDNEIPDYDDEGGYILADMSPCHLFYISSAWATKEGSWPQIFAHCVSTELASICAEATTKSLNKGMTLEQRAAKALKRGKSWDASQKPFKRMPGGLWAAARRGSRSLTGD